MHKIGIIINWISIFACVIGMILGFRELIVHGQPSFWLAMVPGSFLGLLTGMVITLLSKP